jgi:hypothetical protein
VVAVTVADFADSPASFTAATWKAYAVEGASPLTVADVPVAVWTLAPSRYTAYPVAPGTADQDRATLVELTAAVFSPVGAAGG